jgi:hypothetical protein
MSRKQPIRIMFFHHWDNPSSRKESIQAIQEVTDLYYQYRITAHYGFVGAVLQQLEEDSPETVQKIRELKMAIGYHGGAGHNPVSPVGHPKDTRNMPWADAVRAMWEFETHTLDPETRQPIQDRVGGYLLIQTILNIIPLPTDGKGSGRMDSPAEFVLARMGAGSYSIQAPFGKDAILLSPMHEPHLFPGTSLGWPPTYYGPASGKESLSMADPVVWLETLAANLPEDQTYVIHCMTHAGFSLPKLKQVFEYLHANPEDFLVSHPDPDGVQWQPENSASSFYQRTYGIESMLRLLELPAPPDPLGINLTESEIGQISDSVMKTAFLNTHDGDFAEPPEFIAAGSLRVSLASAFLGLAFSLRIYQKTGVLPHELEIPYIQGPIDFPRYTKKVEPRLPDKQFIGYTPTELPLAEVPAAEIINSQGLPPSGDYHIWMPTHLLVTRQEILDTVSRLELETHIPGVIHLQVPSGKPARGIEISINPAEFLYGMAQVYRQITHHLSTEWVALINLKISANQRTECVLIKPGGPQDSFIWRSALSPEELDVAWTRVPAENDDLIPWMSLPPIGDKVKRKMGRQVGEWQLKKR